MTTTVLELNVSGMICRACEDAIADALLHTRGVVSAQAHYWRGRVTITYDPNIVTEDMLRQVLTHAGYPPGTHGMGGVVVDGICLALVGVLYWGLPKLLALVKVPALADNASLGLVFLVGLLTSTHCIGMCGGILLAQGNALLYNGGRLLSYTLMGAVFGALGKYISYDLQVRSMLLTVSGLLVVLIGLRMWGVPFLRRISPELTRPCRFRGKAFAVGLLTGLMPCGALSSMWIFAASSGSWASGAASMLAFGAGTCVFMLLFGLLGTFLPKRYNKYLLKGSTILIVALGLSLMTKGIRLFA